MTALSLMLSLFLGCTPEDKASEADDTASEDADPCAPGDSPELTIGVGESGYEAFEPGGDVELVFGPQGGYHVTLALAAAYVDPDPVWTVTLTGTIDGERWGETVPYAQPRCDPEAGQIIAWNLLLIWDEVDEPDPSALYGQTLDITASVLDMSGAVVEAQTSMVLRDE